MSNPGDLADFLRGKRAALLPEGTPLTGFGVRRRVSGLRREEVAQLAGVSVAYYTRLEQGHSKHASDEVLLGLARALQLTVTETEHLLDLGRGRRVGPGGRGGPERASQASLSMLRALRGRPALVLGRRNDILAWNELGHALFAPHLPAGAPLDPATRPSMPRMVFEDPTVRGMYRDWAEEAGVLVAYLRFLSGRHPDDPALTAMVGELCVRDDAFAALWASGRVGECVAGVKRMQHPNAGTITVGYQLWSQSDRPEQRLQVYEIHGERADEATRALMSVSGASASSRAQAR